MSEVQRIKDQASLGLSVVMGHQNDHHHSSLNDILRPCTIGGTEGQSFKKNK